MNLHWQASGGGAGIERIRPSFVLNELVFGCFMTRMSSLHLSYQILG